MKRINIDTEYNTSKVTCFDKSNYENDANTISNLLMSKNKSINLEANKMMIDPKKIKINKLRNSKDNSSAQDLSLNDLHVAQVFRKLALHEVQKSARGDE